MAFFAEKNDGVRQNLEGWDNGGLWWIVRLDRHGAWGLGLGALAGLPRASVLVAFPKLDDVYATMYWSNCQVLTVSWFETMVCES